MWFALFLSSAFADDEDPLRWLEDPKDPAVISWSEERTAEALEWIDKDGEVDEVAARIEAWSDDHRTYANILDYRAGVGLWTRTERIEPEEDESEDADAEVDEVDEDEEKKTRKKKKNEEEEEDEDEPVFHSQLFVRKQGEPAPGVPLEREGFDVEWPLCQTSLGPNGKQLIWGRLLPKEDEDDEKERRLCSVVVTDLETMEHRSLGEKLGFKASIAPDGESMMASTIEGRKSVLRELDMHGTEQRVLLKSRRTLSPSRLKNGDMAVWTGWTASGKRRKNQRVAWGQDKLEWLPFPKGRYSWVGDIDGDPLFLTKLDKDRRGVVRVDLESPRRKHWVELMADTETEVLQQVRIHGDNYLIATRTDGVVALTQQPVAGGDAVPVFSEHFSWISARRTLEESALIRAGSPQGQRAWLRSREGVLTELDGLVLQADAEFRSIQAPSADGTPIPVSVILPAGLTPNADAPVWLRAYGGFGSGSRAYLGPNEDLWLQMGGIVATVHARGGDERGDEWHEQAKQTQFGLTFDDVIGAGEWFIDEGYSAPGRLVVSGTSNGGLTSMACVARRPELFGAAISTAGVLDLIRGPEMGNWWPAEYGRPGNPEHRAALLADSPVHATPEELPPVLLVTGPSDPTVTPSHSFKLATVWSGQSGGPVLLRVLPWPSHLWHMANKKQKTIRDEIDEDEQERVAGEKLAFLMRALDLELPELPEEEPVESVESGE